jgi:hypothetical protein
MPSRRRIDLDQATVHNRAAAGKCGSGHHQVGLFHRSRWRSWLKRESRRLAVAANTFAQCAPEPNPKRATQLVRALRNAQRKRSQPPRREAGRWGLRSIVQTIANLLQRSSTTQYYHCGRCRVAIDRLCASARSPRLRLILRLLPLVPLKNSCIAPPRQP